MAQGVWLPRFAQINLSVKVLLFGGGDYNKTIEWSDYKHFSGDVKDYKLDTPANVEATIRQQKNKMREVNIIGGGLAGVEAAWQAARLGAQVNLYEMRPVKQTPAHRTDQLAEIVCSNSLKSDEAGTASYLLKEELRQGDSLVMAAAAETRVPAGAALAVDREKFAELITRRIESEPQHPFDPRRSHEHSGRHDHDHRHRSFIFRRVDG